MPLINHKVNLELTWGEKCILSTAGHAATIKIEDAKLYFPIVTLSTKDNMKLTLQSSGEFKRFSYCNEYKITPNVEKELDANNMNNIIEPLDSFFSRC